MKKHLLAAGLAVLAAAASAQTKTVGATGADFTTINAALAFFQPTDPDPITPNVINIIDSGIYDEAITITTPLTLAGTGASRPVICAQLAAVQVDAGDGLCFVMSSAGTVNLTNLIILPSRTSTPTDDLVRYGGTTATTFNISNVLITSNNGADAPLSTDGLTSVPLTGSTSTGDDGIYLSGTNSIYNLTNVVITHIHTGVATGEDGLIIGGAGSEAHIGDGCVFSYNGRLGIQATGSSIFSINAATNRVLLLGNKGFAGIWFGGVQTTTREINGCNVLNTTGATPGTNIGWGIEDNNTGTIPFNISNVIISGCTGQGFELGAVGTGPVNISNTTIANNGLQSIHVSAGAGSSVTVTDSILAGNGSANPTNIIDNSGASTITISNSAIVLAGAQTLTAPGIGGTNVAGITQSAVITTDPQFVQTGTFGAPSTFYRVGNAVDYAAAATGGTALKGGGPAFTDVQNWMSY